MTLTCSSKANPPVQNYTWYKVNGKDTEAVGTGGQSALLVSASAGGHYFCEAWNQYGAQRSEMVYLFFEGMFVPLPTKKTASTKYNFHFPHNGTVIVLLALWDLKP